MVEFERCREIEACAQSHHRFVAGVGLREGWCEVDAGAGRSCGPDCGHSNSFLACRGADDDFVTRNETAHVANFNVGGAGTRISREISAIRLRAYARDCEGLDPMSATLDVQSDFVADGDVGD